MRPQPAKGMREDSAALPSDLRATLERLWYKCGLIGLVSPRVRDDRHSETPSALASGNTMMLRMQSM